jgi:plasmid stabilization system protein ParE
MSDREFEVLWTETAAQDLEEIFFYIAHDSPTNARRVLVRLRTRAETLRTLPSRGRVVPELRDLSLEPWREILERPHRIIYRISGYTVLIMAVLDGRRDLETLLLQRLLRS